MSVFNRRFRALVAAFVTTASCYSPSAPAGAPCSPDGNCPSGQSCVEGVCRLPGQDGDAGLDDGVPGVTCTCSANTLTCSDGASEECTIQCLDGNIPGAARCAAILPSNDIPFATAGPLTELIQLSGLVNVTVNTDTGAITGGFTRPEGTGENNGVIYEQRTFGGQPLGVFYVHSLSIPPLITVRARGSRALVFVAAHSITIAGTLQVSGGAAACTAMPGTQTCAGPGGGTGGTFAGPGGCGPGLDGESNADADSGGGGGGGRTPGGDGGKGNDFPGGTGGIACIESDLEPLVGGSGGGTGSRTQADLVPGFGGGGGGAVQLVAGESITLTNGNIYANGAGGAGGVLDGGDSGGGAGGGAGGGILLEAPVVTLNGNLTANGGGGGSGASANTSMAGDNGEDGRIDATRARGGVSRGAASGTGGRGSVSAIIAGETGETDVNAGGGGGGAGVILVRALGAPDVDGLSSPRLTFMLLRTDE